MNSDEFAGLIARVSPRYTRKYGATIPRAHVAAVQAILDCRSGALGGSVHYCNSCGKQHRFEHSCHHRLCPRCGTRDRQAWIERLKAKLLPVPYSMITFTVPAELRPYIRKRQKLCYHLFYQSSAQALQECAAIDKYIGAELGMIGVLHTWGRQQQYHPHIHYIVPMGGLDAKGAWRRPKSATYFLPIKRLSIKTRIAFSKALEKEDPAYYATIPKSIWRKNWNTDIRLCGGGEKAIEYLGRYVNQSPLPPSRILWAKDGKVCFRYTDSKTHQPKILCLDELEWMRRMLQHVLPKGFARVRHFGWLSAAGKAKFARIVALLDWKSPMATETTRAPLCCGDCGGELRLAAAWRGPRGPRGPPGEVQLLLC